MTSPPLSLLVAPCAQSVAGTASDGLAHAGGTGLRKRGGIMAATSERHRLHQRLVDRDKTALAEIFDEFGPVVFGIILRVTGARGAAEDMTQEILLDLWSRPHRFDPARGNLQPWLATVAHHRAVDWLRHEQAARVRNRRHVQREAVGDVADIGEAVQASMTAERVRKAVAALPGTLGLPIHLAYFCGRTYRQVARDLDLPEGTVKSRIRSGLQRLSVTMAAELAPAS
jgi:RNA polymerase sigma factor (sigma-70 family)